MGRKKIVLYGSVNIFQLWKDLHNKHVEGCYKEIYRFSLKTHGEHKKTVRLLSLLKLNARKITSGGKHIERKEVENQSNSGTLMPDSGERGGDAPNREAQDTKTFLK